MKLKERFSTIRTMIDAMAEPYVVVRSTKTSDGGKEGVLSLVPREIAVPMLVDGKCTIADGDEVAEFYRKDREAHEKQKSELMESRLRRELDFEALAGIRQSRKER